MLTNLAFHHVGIVTGRLAEAAKFYEQLGYSASPVYDDLIQKVSIVLMEREGSPIVELIAPANDKSPAYGWLKRIEGGPYHTCYETPDIEATMRELKAQGVLALGTPVPAVCFNGRRIVFLWSDVAGLIELLEAQR